MLNQVIIIIILVLKDNLILNDIYKLLIHHLFPNLYHLFLNLLSNNNKIKITLGFICLYNGF